jgi:hypothetical protein
VLGLAVLGGFLPSAQAFTLIGSSDLIGWQAAELPIHLDPSQCPDGGAAVRAALQAAVDLWNRVPNSRLKLTVGSDVSVTPTQLKSCVSTSTVPMPVIACDADLGTTLAQDVSTIPAATLGFDCIPSGTTLTYAFILLNADPTASANVGALSSTLLQIVVAHELGHVLGLGHTSNENSLMFYSVGSKSALALSQDDMDGLAFLYPRRELGDGGIFGCGTVRDPGDWGDPRHGGARDPVRDGGGMPAAFSFGTLLLFCAWAVRMAKGRRYELKAIHH